MKEKEVKITFRGWAGHFICSYRCLFQLNTLVEYGDQKVVVSTVGRMMKKSISTYLHNYEEVGNGRYYETMVFMAKKFDEVWDADVQKQVYFESEWAYSRIEDGWKANKGHYAVIEEISKKLKEGKLNIEER